MSATIRSLTACGAVLPEYAEQGPNVPRDQTGWQTHSATSKPTYMYAMARRR